MGKCAGCGEWNTLVEEVAEGGGAVRKARVAAATVTRLADVQTEGEVRIGSKIAELDRVLGGGIVPGSAVLIGGEPGIGKSTLLLQLAGALSGAGLRVLYCSGEESASQIGMRARRLGVGADVLLLTDPVLETVLATAVVEAPDIIIVDSVQTIVSSDVASSPGSVTQLRAVTSALVTHAKTTNVAVFLVGHVTKDGQIAGPKLLEHMVDTVLYFESARGAPYRFLRAVKNRFGSTNEIGVFEMTSAGLIEIPDPSRLFLSGRSEHASGSVVACTFEGTRPLLVEVQALVTQSSYGPPRVTAVGLETSRVLLILQILEKRTGLQIAGQDVFVNIAGGVRALEPGLDLAIVAALASSHMDRAVPTDVALFGEVGLTGEVRAVDQARSRVGELAKLGFARCVLPTGNRTVFDREGGAPEGMLLEAVSTVPEALETLFGVS
jgi:DNA repair protein RadA/Sms